MQKDVPSEEIKTGEEDDDDNGDNLLKDSNDSTSSDLSDEDSFGLGPFFNLSAVFRPGPSIQNKMVTNQQMDEVAAKLGGRWKALAGQLEMKAAELREIETDSEDVEMQAKLLLVAWQEREGTQATVDNLAVALNVAGFSQLAESLSEG